jgi:hypothetical protein
MKNKSKGAIGSSAIWDGPLSEVGRSKGKGSSSGINGMQISKAYVKYCPGPITSKAKAE